MLDDNACQSLAILLRSQYVASLGTLQNTAPYVSMVLFATAPDLSAYYIQVSRLAVHTRNILNDPRVALMIPEMRTSISDPQQLARISIAGEARLVRPLDVDYQDIKATYIEKFPKTAVNFTFADFMMFSIVPQSARYVAGFGKIFELALQDIKRVAAYF